MLLKGCEIQDIWRHFEPGCNWLHSLYLPKLIQPTSEPVDQTSRSDSGKLLSFEQAELDLEFPTLSATLAKATEKGTTKGSKGDTHHDASKPSDILAHFFNV